MTRYAELPLDHLQISHGGHFCKSIKSSFDHAILDLHNESLNTLNLIMDIRLIDLTKVMWLRVDLVIRVFGFMVRNRWTFRDDIYILIYTRRRMEYSDTETYTFSKDLTRDKH